MIVLSYVCPTIQKISAEIILKSKSGLSMVSEDTIIMSRNIGQYYPTLENVNRVTLKLREMGFSVF